MKMSRKLFAGLAILAGILGSVYGIWSCAQASNPEIQTITIGSSLNETNSLLFIADDLGYFPGNNLNVVLKRYDSGVEAVDSLLKSEVDLATCSEFVLVRNILNNQDLEAITVIDKFQITYLVGRTDIAVKTLADLKGKRIGITGHTSDEFYLSRFLELNGIPSKDLTLVNIKRAESIDALINGLVDAVACIEPQASEIKRRLSGQVQVWPIQSGQPGNLVMISNRVWLNAHPDAAFRLIKSIVQAEQYLETHPEQAKAIIQRRLQYEEVYFNQVWGEHDFSLSLDQSLILGMEDQARWMISDNQTLKNTMPDFLDHIYIDALKAVKPEAFKIIAK
jgi:ABC-type nitrate/sulfonate/bicarbonate transport system substrate-binding protein